MNEEEKEEIQQKDRIDILAERLDALIGWAEYHQKFTDRQRKNIGLMWRELKELKEEFERQKAMKC